MRYRIRQKMFTLGDKFTIQDEDGQDRFFVEGQALSFGDKLRVLDAAGTEQAYIEQKLMSLMPRYRVYRDGELFAEVLKEFTWFKKKFTLDVPGPNDYTITGSFWDHEFTFERGGRVIANVSKKIMSWTDSYCVDVIDGEDDVAILSAVIVIDMVCSDERSGAV